MKQNNAQTKSIFSGVAMGYLILILHLLLIVGLGMTVVFLKSLYDIRWLLLAGGLLLIALSAWYFYKRIKNNSRKIFAMMNAPALRGRSVEVSLLGGIASFRVGNDREQASTPVLIDEHGNDIKQLEMSKPNPLNSLSELKALLDDDLITKEEFLQLKHEIMNTSTE